MSFHPLRVPEEKEKELQEGKAPDTEAQPAEDTKDKIHVQEEVFGLALRVGRCHFKDAFLNEVLAISLKNR